MTTHRRRIDFGDDDQPTGESPSIEYVFDPTQFFFILDADRNVVPADVFEWGRWFERADNGRQIGLDQIGPYRVSTVFIGLGHPSGDGSFDWMFETMIFGDEKLVEYVSQSAPEDSESIVSKFLRLVGGGFGRDYQVRYKTWREAEAGHKAAVELAKKAVASMN